ncbi:MAG: hypothetical protein NTX29_03595 [Actinobacteria bacterium]|nr:hypothetical protein [Actinomycetota bacterium]
MSATVTVFVVSLAVTAVALPIVRAGLVRRNVLDHPNDRSSHAVATPRGAGVGQLAGMLAGMAAAGGLPVAAFVAVVGFSGLGAVDDWRAQPARVRLIAQVLLSGVVVGALAWQWRPGGLAVWVALASFLIFPVAVNAANFMDGINGISAAHGLVLGAVYCLLLMGADAGAWSMVGVALAAASVAFFPWNWRARAAMFLGDSGSYLLGAAVALMMMACWANGISILVALAPFAIYLVDVGATIVRRGLSGESLTTAHRDHAYQRLVQEGWSHRATALFVAGLSALCGILAVSTQRGWIPVAVMVLLIVGLAFIYLWSPTLARRGRSHSDGAQES